MTDDNPFAPPTVPPEPAPWIQPERRWGLILLWMVMFAVNLPVAVMFGRSACDWPAAFGMVVGCALINVTGLWLCRTSPHFMLRLCLGSIAVAVSQFFPVLHMIVGMIAVGISRSICNLSIEMSDPIRGNMTGLDEVTLSTLLTGLGLILPSVAMGYLIGMVFRLPSKSPSE